ncbi:MAG: nuclear transport factor 2 family protein [Pseudomonadota bacterium]|nr:nuclear transport factor 2 family protein [Pseudomonadota bacterium]
MVDKEHAERFAGEWLDAWNAHDLDRILSHYEETFTMSSPAITRLTGNSSGTLQGKPAVGKYWADALARYPNLHFKLLHLLRGVDSVTLIYDGVLGVTAEVFHFGPTGKVTRACAHYDL